MTTFQTPGRPAAPDASRNSDRLPAWVAWLDALTLALVALALLVWLRGGFRVSLGGATVSVTAWWRLGIWALGLALVRHALRPRPSQPARLLALLRPARGASACRSAVWGVGLWSRLGILLVAYVCVSAFDAPPGHVAVPFAPDPLSALVERGEVTPHLAAAAFGYGATLSPDAPRRPVFPAMPLAIRAGARLTGWPLLSGVVVAAGAFLWALAYLYRLGRRFLDRDQAATAVSLLAAYPLAVFYSVPCSDSLTLLASVGAAYHLQRHQLVAASLWGALLGLTCPGGILFSVPLLWLAFRRERGEVSPVASGLRAADDPVPPPPARLALRFLAALSPVLASAAFASHVARVNGESIGAALAALWPVSRTPLQGLAKPFEWLLGAGFLPALAAAPVPVLDALAVTGTLLVLWPVARRFGAAFAAWVVAGLLGALLFGQPTSVARQTAVLFPLFLWLGAKVRFEHRLAWVALFGTFQAIVACVFFSWRAAF